MRKIIFILACVLSLSFNAQRIDNSKIINKSWKDATSWEKITVHYNFTQDSLTIRIHITKDIDKVHAYYFTDEKPISFDDKKVGMKTSGKYLVCKFEKGKNADKDGFFCLEIKEQSDDRLLIDVFGSDHEFFRVE